MKKTALLFLLGLLIVAVGCRKEHVLTKEQDFKKEPSSNNSNKNLDGVWVALEWQRVEIYYSDTAYTPKEFNTEGPYGFFIDEYDLTGEKYNDTTALLKVFDGNTYLGKWTLDKWKDDLDNLDPDYRYWVWITRLNPIDQKLGRMKLGKREAD